MKPTVVCLALLTALLITPAMVFADSAAPTVNITAPEPGITITTDSVDIGVEYVAPEKLKITRVALLVDGARVGAADFDPPQVRGVVYFTWQTSDYGDGEHEVTARAVDSKGSVGTKTITVLVQRGLPALATALRIVSPKNGKRVSGMTEIRLEGDPQGLVRYVIFLVDNVFKAMTNVRPFAYRWDSTRYLNGLHRLQARAYLHEGSDYLTSIVEVQVDNPSGATPMRQEEVKPVAPTSPAPVTLPARAETPTLPPPMRTESDTPEPRLVEVAEPELTRPGTAPFVSATGDLIRPPSTSAADRSPEAAPVVIAALPSEVAEQPTKPVVAGTVTVDLPAVSAKDTGEPLAKIADVALTPGLAGPELVTQPSPELAPVEVASPPGLELSAAGAAQAPAPASPVCVPAERPALEPAMAPATEVEVAALPSPVVESAPSLPAPKTIAAEANPRSAVTTQRPAAPKQNPAPASVQMAMLPPLPTATPPAPKLTAQPESPRTIYVVREGDCLWGIAEKHGVSPWELGKANGISDLRAIYPGQRLTVPTVQLYADGKLLVTDTPISVYDGQTIAPFRAVVEHVGGKVVWDANRRSATGAARGRRIAVTIGSDQAQVDGGSVPMGARAELRNDRTVVPLRFLGHVLGLGLRCERGVVHIASAR